MTKEALQRFAALIRQLRGNRSLNGFGNEIGVSATAIQDWEKAGTVPSTPNLQKVAELLGWRLDQLMGYLETGEEPEEISPSPPPQQRVDPQAARSSQARSVAQRYYDVYLALVEMFAQTEMDPDYRPSPDHLVTMTCAAVSHQSSQSLGPFRYAGVVKAN